jgi:hypothetical protein
MENPKKTATKRKNTKAEVTEGETTQPESPNKSLKKSEENLNQSQETSQETSQSNNNNNTESKQEEDKPKPEPSKPEKKQLLTVNYRDLIQPGVLERVLESGNPFLPEDKKKPIFISIFFRISEYELLVNGVMNLGAAHWQALRNHFGKFPTILSTPCFFRLPFGYSPQYDDKNGEYSISMRMNLNADESDNPEVAKEYIETFLPAMDSQVAKIVHKNWPGFKLNSNPSLDTVRGAVTTKKTSLTPGYSDYMIFKFLNMTNDKNEKIKTSAECAVWTWDGEDTTPATKLADNLTMENSSGHKSPTGEFIAPDPKLNFVPKDSWVRIVYAHTNSVSISRAKMEIYQSNIALAIIVASDSLVQKLKNKRIGITDTPLLTGPPIPTKEW